MNTSPISAKGHPQGARTMDEDIDMETSAEMKQADMGEDVDMETTEAKIADEGNEDETMGADGGVYIAELILGHRMDFEDDKTRYLVKWKGVRESEPTWEPEDQLFGSRDVLEAYWDRLGEKPTQKTKRGGSPAGGNTNKELPFKFAPDGSDEWLPPVPSAGNWETLVHVVENIEKDEKGAVWANLLWNKMKKDGDPIRNKAPVWTCYMACPQKMLDFYEKHIVFTQSKV